MHITVNMKVSADVLRSIMKALSGAAARIGIKLKSDEVTSDCRDDHVASVEVEFQPGKFAAPQRDYVQAILQESLRTCIRQLGQGGLVASDFVLNVYLPEPGGSEATRGSE